MKHIQKLRKLILTLGILAGMSLTAYADSAQPSVTISPENGGSVSFNTTGSGSDIFYVFTATPAEGYHFVKWTFSLNGKQDSRSSNPWRVVSTNFTLGYYGDVTAVFEQNIVVSNISLDQSAISLSVGGTQTLTSTISPDNATYKTVTWTSGDENVATVDATGKVTAVGLGTATITVTATNGTDDTSDDKTATCTVTVTAEKAALTEAITAAETLYDSIKDNTDYSTIASTLKAAIDAAKEVANSDTADQDAVDAATTAITTAKTNAENEYKEAQKTAAEQPVTVAAKADPFTTGTYYATFYDSTTSYVADCEVYYATENADGRLTLEKAEGNVIKAGEGVILKATSETVTLTPTTTEANYDSLLTGSDSETTVENALVLSLGKNGVWFYKYSGTLGANKAYLAQ